MYELLLLAHGRKSAAMPLKSETLCRFESGNGERKMRWED